jgi:intron-binding protein aquarius
VKRIYETYFATLSDEVKELVRSDYLENYLWRHLSAESSFEHLLSIISLFNEKFSENSQPYETFNCEEKLQVLFNFITSNFPSTALLSIPQKTTVVSFLIHTMQCFDNEMIRRYWFKYFSLPIWKSLSSERREKEFQSYPQLERHWFHLIEKQSQETSLESEPTAVVGKRKGRSAAKATPSKKQKVVDPQPDLEAEWFPSVVEDCLLVLNGASLGNDVDHNARGPYLERLCEMFVDLLSQLPTRRFVHSLLDDYQLIIRFKRSPLCQDNNSNTLHQLVSQFHAVLSFGIENQTGKSLSPHEMIGLRNQELQRLQQVAYLNFKEQCSEVIYSSTGELGKEENFRKLFSLIPLDCLVDLAKKLGYVSSAPRSTDVPLTIEYVLDILVEKLCFKHSLMATAKQLILHPTGELILLQSSHCSQKRQFGTTTCSL